MTLLCTVKAGYKQHLIKDGLEKLSANVLLSYPFEFLINNKIYIRRIEKDFVFLRFLYYNRKLSINEFTIDGFYCYKGSILHKESHIDTLDYKDHF
ncbi:hypothetical protein BpHYR1_032485 [Brachionus plicatilis]|uniref:Uncharacterized protein n=1 Tax=Brachionus plicatilis TaxID=10195 RepID=A0A3M7QLH1_BRAPC|nr:hypothetical protein BpHYR1_032485 [Brachionus plicatilis]